MRRRDFITCLGGAAMMWPLAARSQVRKVYRIGVLETISPALNAKNLRGLKEGLERLGYVEGRNYILEYRSADGRTESFPQLMADLVRLNVDLIVTRGTPAALAAKAATTTIPIVMAAIGEPLVAVASLARPGGNITGLSAFVSELDAKRVELLREAVPGASHFAVIRNMSNPASTPEWSEVQSGARKLGLKATLFDVRRDEELGPAFDAAREQRCDGVLVGLDTLTQKNLNVIVELAAKYRLPTMYTTREFVDAGGLMSYGVNYPDLYRRAATFVDRILKGEQPSELPIEQPVKIDLVIHNRSARVLGLTVPEKLLVIADDVIE